MSQSLVILAKWPESGQSKTRLAEELGTERALLIAQAFLKDVLLRLESLPVRKVLAFAPAEAREHFTQLAGKGYALKPQADGDLGGRLHTLLLSEWEEGQCEVVFLGTDSPTLPLPWIEQAFEQLLQVDVVLGPAVDGGYYLLGCRRSPRWIAILEKLTISESSTQASADVSSRLRSIGRRLPIFTDIAWGSSQVLAQTIAQLEMSGLRLALLPVWYDVDTAADWHFLQTHVRALRCAGVEPVVPHTEALITELTDES